MVFYPFTIPWYQKDTGLWKILVRRAHRSSKCWPSPLKSIRKSHLLISPPSIRKVFKCLGSCRTHKSSCKCLQILIFALKRKCIIGNKHHLWFYMKWYSVTVFSRTCLSGIWNRLPAVLSSKRGVTWKQGSQSAFRSKPTAELSLKQASPWGTQRESPTCIPHFVMQSIKRLYSRVRV